MGEKYPTGSVVRLKSGGPSMVVYRIKDTSNVHVTWFDKAGELRQGLVPVECLEPSK